MFCSMIIKLVSAKVDTAKHIAPPPETRIDCVDDVLLFRNEGELSNIAEVKYGSGISIWPSLAYFAFVDSLSKARSFYKEALAQYFDQNPPERLIEKLFSNSPLQISILIHGAKLHEPKNELNTNTARYKYNIFCQGDTHNLDKINIQIAVYT